MNLYRPENNVTMRTVKHTSLCAISSILLKSPTPSLKTPPTKNMSANQNAQNDESEAEVCSDWLLFSFRLKSAEFQIQKQAWFLMLLKLLLFLYKNIISYLVFLFLYRVKWHLGIFWWGARLHVHSKLNFTTTSLIHVFTDKRNWQSTELLHNC